MAHGKRGRQRRARPPNPETSPEALLAAAHDALDALERSLRALPAADHLVDTVLRLRGMMIELFAGGLPGNEPPRGAPPARTGAGDDASPGPEAC